MTDEPMDLGHSHVVRFTCWAPDRDLNPELADLPDVYPFGLIDDHNKPDGTPCAGGCIVFEGEVARAVSPNVPTWTLESLDPLTVSPSLLCACGDHGWIRDGRWVPA